MITSTGNCYKYYTQCYYTISTVVTKQSQVRVFTLLSPPDDHVRLPHHVSLLDHVPYKALWVDASNRSFKLKVNLHLEETFSLTLLVISNCDVKVTKRSE